MCSPWHIKLNCRTHDLSEHLAIVHVCSWHFPYVCMTSSHCYGYNLISWYWLVNVKYINKDVLRWIKTLGYWLSLNSVAVLPRLWKSLLIELTMVSLTGLSNLFEKNQAVAVTPWWLAYLPILGMNTGTVPLVKPPFLLASGFLDLTVHFGYCLGWNWHRASTSWNRKTICDDVIHT